MISGGFNISATSRGQRPHVMQPAAALVRSAQVPSDARSRTTGSQAGRTSTPIDALRLPVVAGYASPLGNGRRYFRECKFLFRPCSSDSRVGAALAPLCRATREASVDRGFAPLVGRRNLISERGCRRATLIGQASELPCRQRPLEPGRYAPAGSRDAVLDHQKNPRVHLHHSLALRGRRRLQDHQ